MTSKYAVIIPCYKVKDHILTVIRNIGPAVHAIIAVDDCCPEKSGDFIRSNCQDPRVTVLKNEVNLGVGGATLVGFQYAFDHGFDIMIKMDGDNQMDHRYLEPMIAIIMTRKADFVKGNRFFNLEDLKDMPTVRLIGNAGLSFLSKISCGYYNLFDPTNGFIALHRNTFATLPTKKISKRYFFESDLLFRLYLSRAVAFDLPMSATYGEEISNLKIRKILLPFLIGHFRNFCKRIFYSYFLRDFSIASLYLMTGVPMLIAGGAYGIYSWVTHHQLGTETPPGTVMLASLPIIIGFNCLLSFFTYDVGNFPKEPLYHQEKARL